MLADERRFRITEILTRQRTVTAADLTTMLGVTAARVYGLDLGELTAIAAGIDSPTMKELRQPVFEAPPGVNSFAFRKNGWWD